MKTLKDKTPLEILKILKVIVLTFDNIEDIDENYGLDFSIGDFVNRWRITYTWARGAYINTESNPIYSKDDLLMDKGEFFIPKNGTTKELIRLVKTVIDKVTLNLFDPEIED